MEEKNHIFSSLGFSNFLTMQLLERGCLLPIVVVLCVLFFQLFGFGFFVM